VKLFKLTTRFVGKHLDKLVMLGFVLADTEEQVARHISWKYHYGEWLGDEFSEDPEEREHLLADYVAHKGDFHAPPEGDYHTQGFGWEEMGEVTEEQAAVLRAVGVVDELITSSPFKNPNAPE
jgi:hypothetical protein